MKKLDLEGWERREIFEFMSSLKNPFYSVSFGMDVTRVYEFAHSRGVSFYYTMIWLCARAINAVPAFLNDVKDGEIVVLEGRAPSFCDIRRGSEAFYIVNTELTCGAEEFCAAAKKASLESAAFYPTWEPENGALIYFSCFPWIDLKSATNAMDPDPDDTVPRLCWGKYQDEGGKKRLNIALEVNHRFIDGYHIGLFAGELERLIGELK